MLKKLVILLLILPIVYAEDLTPYTFVTSKVEIDGTIDLAYLSASESELDYFEASLYFYPLEFVGQEVKKLNVDSLDGKTDLNDGVKFRWNGDMTRLEYGLNAEVKSKNLFRNIDKKIPFPYDFREDHSEFLSEREFIDITPSIRNQANEIVAGEDDYYDAVFKVAEWTRSNIEYDLNSLTEKSVQKSSWVLENKFGVCDELTNLFTSMLRSLGIPVRYVSGLAHSEVVGGWSPHAWSEVYFPGKGWIPFDVTFGEYGWVDAGHIKMAEGSDANEPSVEYFWRAVKVGIQDKEFIVNASLIELGEKFYSFVELDVNILENEVGGGSYVPIEVTVKNLQPFYFSTLIYVAAAPGLIGDNAQGVLLKPLQEKKVYWLVNITDSLEKGYKYTGQIIVKDALGAETNGKVIFADNYDVVTLSQASLRLDELIEIEEKTIAYDLDLDCSSERENYYFEEIALINCEVRNKGNSPLSFSLCLENDCRTLNLKINEKKTEEFNYDLKNFNEIQIIASNNEISFEEDIELNVFNEPLFVVESLNYLDVDYDQRGSIDVDVSVVPEVENLVIEVDYLGSFDFESVAGSESLSLRFDAWDLKIGENVLGLNFEYYFKDEKYTFSEQVTVNVNDIGFFDKVLVKIRKLF